MVGRSVHENPFLVHESTLTVRDVHVPELSSGQINCSKISAAIQGRQRIDFIDQKEGVQTRHGFSGLWDIYGDTTLRVPCYGPDETSDRAQPDSEGV